MDDKELLDLYSDYLISSFGQTTGTGMADLLGGSISHDRIQRWLSKQDFTSADLWQIVKPHVRGMQQADGVLIIDDSIAEKPYTDENEIICWHYDHAHDRQVKGINFLTALYHAGGQSLPVGFRIVAKTEYYTDKKDGKTKRRSPISKNEHYQGFKWNPIAPRRTLLPRPWLPLSIGRLKIAGAWIERRSVELGALCRTELPGL